MARFLNYGMVGGGPGAFIGAAHRRSISLDGQAQLVAGCFSRTLEKCRESGKTLGLDADRCYNSAAEMAAAERSRPDGIDFIVVVTPNHSHFAICREFLNAGFHVACDKPVTVTLEQAKELERLAQEKDRLFMVTYIYTGHVSFKHAREAIKAGEIGEIRTVMAEYPQGWLSREGDSGGRQGAWRCDPKQSGNTNCLGDLGTHVENAVSTMTGLTAKRVLAKMDVVVAGRVLDDNDVVMVEFEGGTTGVYWTSQIAIGHDNSLKVRVYGSKGTIEWFQENPEELKMIDEAGNIKIIHRGYSSIALNAAKYGRLPSGHTEGWFEAMGNLYQSFIECIHAKENGTFSGAMIDYPTVSDGAEGLAFVEACIESSKSGNCWVNLKK